MEEIVVIGAGLYGLYSAIKIANIKKDCKVWILECDSESFGRATYINQARVHMGYHYPRSLSTAVKSAKYFERFNKDYDFCINKEFVQIYATSKDFSWTNKNEFVKFCNDANIPCEKVSPSTYFNENCCDGAFITKEYTYDAHLLRDYLLKQIAGIENIEIKYDSYIETIERINLEGINKYIIKLSSGLTIETKFILNATYAGINTILNKLGLPLFDIKYELCEIILCEVNDGLKDKGLTVMDGPFFSIMPFGKTGYHSLTSVTFTPHITSYNKLPTFDCQKKVPNGYCNPNHLGNCNNCPARPQSSWDYMSSLARKYVKEKYTFKYVKSLFSVKPILMISEIDDSRPTVIKVFERNPTFISVLSGKINTVYDLDEVLKDELK